MSRPVLARSLRDLADPTTLAPAHDPQEFRAVELSVDLRLASIELIKLARLLPAALVEPLRRKPPWPGREVCPARELLDVTAEAIDSYQKLAAQSLRPVGEARVPLAGAEKTRIVAFRPGDGGTEHLAIIIGEPPTDPSGPGAPAFRMLHRRPPGQPALRLRRPAARRHRRDRQARGRASCSIWRRKAAASGWSTSCAPIGCRISGVDTVDANRAARLRGRRARSIYRPPRCCGSWAISEVRLLTNNPAKVDGLRRCGVAVVERVPHVFPVQWPQRALSRDQGRAKFGHCDVGPRHAVAKTDGPDRQRGWLGVVERQALSLRRRSRGVRRDKREGDGATPAGRFPFAACCISAPIACRTVDADCRSQPIDRRRRLVRRSGRAHYNRAGPAALRRRP